MFLMGYQIKDDDDEYLLKLGETMFKGQKKVGSVLQDFLNGTFKCWFRCVDRYSKKFVHRV